MGLAVGVAAGLTAGLLAAPMRGTDMRASLRERASDGGARLQSLADSYRSWAQDTLDRTMMLFDEGRRAFNTSSQPSTSAPPVLTATLGEIAQMHSGEPLTAERLS